jgi:hypothetical protein
MTAASGIDTPAPPRRSHGLDPLPGEPPGLFLIDRLILTAVRRVGTLSEQAQGEIWSAVSGCRPGRRAAEHWDRLAAAERARREP